MTIPNMGQQEFVDFLKENGCKVVSDKDWNDYNRIMMEKDGISFPLQLKGVFFYYTVCKICDDLGISPPEEHDKVRKQIKNKK